MPFFFILFIVNCHRNKKNTFEISPFSLVTLKLKSACYSECLQIKTFSNSKNNAFFLFSSGKKKKSFIEIIIYYLKKANTHFSFPIFPDPVVLNGFLRILHPYRFCLCVESSNHVWVSDQKKIVVAN